MSATGPDVVVCGRGVPTCESPLLGIFELDQARALRRAGLEVVYAGLDVRSLRHWRAWGIRRSTVGGVPVLVLNVPLGRLPRGVNRWLMARLWDVLLSLVATEQGRPQLLHGHFLAWTSALAGRRSLRGVPLVLTEHWSRLRGRIPEDIAALGRRAYPAAAAVLAVSRPLARAIEEGFGVSAVVVPDIVEVEAFGAVAEVPRAPGVRLVTTANLIRRKNIEGLLRAFAAVAPASAELVVIGQGDQRRALEDLAEGLGVRHRVRFTGRLSREELVDEYARATGFALVSHAETFGVVWAEALGAGLPVLATRCGGPEDFVGPANGVLVDDTAEAITTGLAELCAGIMAGRWSGAEVAQSVQRFSAEAVTEQLIAIYAAVEDRS